MEILNKKLAALHAALANGETLRIAILGLGSVGNFLLNYLNAWSFSNAEIYVGARNTEKAEKDANISKVASIIRDGKTKPIHILPVDLGSVESIAEFIRTVRPHFIVNSSRVYSGLKYGSISWHNIRAYGLWSPLSIGFIKNIMQAHEAADSDSIVINTSYSDAVIPWLKSAGLHYPEFGSGNLNHLIPRIKMAVAETMGLADASKVDVTLATSHFHDVVISKEGHTEGVDPLLHLEYEGKEIHPDMQAVWTKCAIAMPVDAKRNMMNASSNFEIIRKVVEALTENAPRTIHTPGVCGHIGGYPVVVDGSATPMAKFDERVFALADMEAVNRRSIYLDGIEDVTEGCLVYTDKLREKVRKAFGAEIPKRVPFVEIDATAKHIISAIIEPQIGRA